MCLEARATETRRANASSNDPFVTGSYAKTSSDARAEVFSSVEKTLREDASSSSRDAVVRDAPASIVPRRICSYCARISTTVSSAASVSIPLGAMTNEHTCFPREPTGSNGAAVHADGFRSKTSGATRSASPWYPTAMETRNASVTEAVGGGSEHLFRHPYLSTSTRAVSVTLHVLSVVASVASVASRVSPASKRTRRRVGVGDGAPRERRQNFRRSKHATSHVARHTHVRVCRLCVRAFRRHSTSRLVRGTVGDVARRRFFFNAPRISASRFLGSRFRLRSRRREQRARPRLMNRVCPTRFDVTIGGHDVHTIGRVRPPFRRRARLSRARGLPRPRRRLRGTRRASREARVEVRGIASRRRRGHVRGRAGERAEEVRAPARVPAGRVPRWNPARHDASAAGATARLASDDVSGVSSAIERNTRRGAPARPPPPPRPRTPPRLPPPRRDRTSSPRARTPGRAPLALARDFRGAIRAFRVESFSTTSRKKSAAHRPRRPFDRLRPLFFFRASFRFQRKKNAQRKNTFRMHTSPTLLHHRSMAVGASHFFHAF